MKDIWLVGTGLMSDDYAKVLLNLKANFIAIGRGKENCDRFSEKFGVTTVEGGLTQFLSSSPSSPQAAIVSVGIENLATTCRELIHYGVKYILLEKPGVGYPVEIFELNQIAKASDAKVFLAYNRRFYSSVLKAQEIIKEDGGVTSFNFEFTEWSHVISTLTKHEAEHRNWFLGNSTHIIDTAFYLSGEPQELCAFYKGGLDWHPSSSIFAGAGISKTGALFSYQANWESPGRWVIEILTRKHRLIFKPIESLQIQKIGSVAVEPVVIDDHLDKEFKPGLYLQVQAFLNRDVANFCTLEEQERMIVDHYCRMSGYSLS